MLRLGEYELEYPGLMNGGGMVKTVEDVQRILPAVDAVVVGSITLRPREGNSGETYWYDEGTGTSYNSLNMPNGGRPYYETALPEMIRLAHEAGKPLVANVAGFSVDDFVVLAVMAAETGVDGVELNFGCPNTGHQVFSFDPELVREVLVGIQKVRSGSTRLPSLGVKLSPITDPALRGLLVPALVGRCDYVVVTNTLPNIVAFRDDGTPAIQATNPDGGAVNVGGGAGEPLRPISLTMAAEFRKNLPSEMQVVRVGGICNGMDLLDSLRVGTHAVQVATAFMQEGNGVFTRLREELAALESSVPA